jgi:hypothetical protein
VIFDHEWRADAPQYAGRHRKGWLAGIGDRRRGYRVRIRVGQDAAAPLITPPAKRELQVAGRHGGGQAR